MRTLYLAVAIGTLACSAGRTEVLVVVDTDYAVPAELDEVRIDLIGPSGETRRSEGPIRSPGDLPKTLGLVDATNGARDVRVTVTGLRAGANVVQRRAVFSFVPFETRVLRMDLWRGCEGVACPADETCGDNGCRPLRVAPEELRPYPDAAGRVDAAIDDAGDDCVPAAEACNELDDDCDGHTDEGFALETDLENCGACGVACARAPQNASSACEGGECAVRCDPGFLDCDGEIGCEAVLGDRVHCGACGVVCEGATPLCAQTDAGYECTAACSAGTTDCSGSCVDLTSSPLRCGGCATRCLAPANASATCVASTCGYRCDAGYGDCDGDASNGCEASLRDEAHCGSCGESCWRDGAIVSCASGRCETVACEAFRIDCDGSPANGCEADVGGDVLRCGGCDVVCPPRANADAICRDGRCALACDAGYADCDGRADNGCEKSLASPGSCGACGIACSDPSPFCEAVGGGYACTDGCGGATSCEMSCVDTSSDPLHCGGCGAACESALNARTLCAGGACVLACDAGYADCDGAPGCEARIASDVDRCGGCSSVCPNAAFAIRECADGACTYRCESGYADCNGLAADGCEVDLATDPDHCGRCDNACTSGPGVGASDCYAGACRITSCNGALADCDRNAVNGCETDTSADLANCGACDQTCSTSRRCCGGTCARPADCPILPAGGP